MTFDMYLLIANLLWVVFAVLGTLINALVLREAVQDQKALATSTANGVAQIIASESTIQEWVRMMMQVVILAGGIVRLVIQVDEPKVFMPAMTATLVIVLVSVMIMMNGLREMTLRRRVLHEQAREIQRAKRQSWSPQPEP